MIEVTKAKVQSFSLDYFDLFWEISEVRGPVGDEPHEIFDYEFYILRSGDSPSGPYEQIAGPFRDRYMFRDQRVATLHKWRQYFYKIKVVHKPTGAFREFGPIASDTQEPDLVASEIIRQEDVLFRQFIGRKCWLFILRTFGPRCSCYDTTLARRTRSNHKPCYGSGFLAGYMSPIEVFIQIDPSGKNIQSSPLQEMQPQDSRGRMTNFPPISPGDIIVENSNSRWRVVNVAQTERLRSVVHQEFALRQIPKGDIEYLLPVNVDGSTLVEFEERNFTNPHSLDDNEDYSDIIATYGFPRGSSR